ncbi:MAG TPA: type III pantothenate kinase [Gemmatimonadaceae bacterium]|nr:type III pantothenate kinase [Gemmatimonadaceae bacterium]
MLLVCDVGNTETTIGLADADAIVAHWRVMTQSARTPHEFALLLRGLLDLHGTAPGRVLAAAIGSVVPAVTAPLADGIALAFGITPLIVDASSALPITLDVEEPQTVGADRIINTLAASRLYAEDCIVVDLGTATTYDCITRDGVFLGGVIAPGVLTSLETLTRRTSKLPATELRAPARVLGRRTEECIRSGVVYGAVDAITGIVGRLRAEWPTGRTPLVIGTGGLAAMLAPFCPVLAVVDADLTLRGLLLAHQLLAAD